MMLTHWNIAEAIASEHRRNLEADASRRRLARQARRVGRRAHRGTSAPSP